ncbi:uncharacterized protein N7473_006999, partial [Penicillium subrubescens]|uniref:uncharacterized protein n=1 Tax=Penicillium subrubescens TaxID=1316194 RepID=UPI0025457E14
CSHTLSVYFSEECSDLTIVCGDKVLKAHRLVVCSQSDYFRKACCGIFKEAHQPIKFPDKHPTVMEKVLGYFYTGDYTLKLGSGRCSATSSSKNIRHQQSPSSAARPVVLVDNSSFPASMALSQSTSSSLIPVGSNEVDIEPSPTRNLALFHARVYGEGDYVLVEGLKTMTQAEFTTDLTKSLTKEDPKTAALDETLEELYSTRANYYSLRCIAIRQIVENIHVVSVKHGVPLRKSMKSIPDFAFDLCMALMKEKCSFEISPGGQAVLRGKS